MSDQESSFAKVSRNYRIFNDSRAYRPWGQVRRKNLISRILYAVVMTVVGLAVLAALAVLFLFAASVAVAGVIAFALMAVMAAFTRKPAKVAIRSDGVMEARKKGSTWTVY
ncbi:MAG: hypothetical protein JF615_11010 [Asticcacaulis sp.]|nr:hypothetical protein [Asticcacaulis sp.]